MRRIALHDVLGGEASRVVALPVAELRLAVDLGPLLAAIPTSTRAAVVDALAAYAAWGDEEEPSSLASAALDLTPGAVRLLSDLDTDVRTSGPRAEHYFEWARAIADRHEARGFALSARKDRFEATARVLVIRQRALVTLLRRYLDVRSSHTLGSVYALLSSLGWSPCWPPSHRHVA